MKSRIVFAACVYLFHVSRCFASTGKDSFDGGNYVANWTYNNETDKICVQVEVNTTGWVGFGFAEKAPTGMNNYDVAVGGVRGGNGKEYLVDCYTEGEIKPPADDQQDYNLTSAIVEDGKTKLTFERKRDTGDNKDVQLKAGEGVFLIWAYQSSSEGDNFSTLQKHFKKGKSEQKVVIIPGSTVVATTTSAAVAPTSAAVAPTSVKTTTRTTSPAASAAPTKPSTANFIVVLAVMLSFLYI